MTTNELRVLSIIWNWGGEASVDIIARETGISTNYARLLCESLRREGCIDFLHSKLCKIKSKGKILVAEKRLQSGHHPSVFNRSLGQNLYPPKFSEGKFRRARKIVIPERANKFGLGRNKKGRLTLDY